MKYSSNCQRSMMNTFSNLNSSSPRSTSSVQSINDERNRLPSFFKSDLENIIGTPVSTYADLLNEIILLKNHSDILSLAQEASQLSDNDELCSGSFIDKTNLNKTIVEGDLIGSIPPYSAKLEKLNTELIQRLQEAEKANGNFEQQILEYQSKISSLEQAFQSCREIVSDQHKEINKLSQQRNVLAEKTIQLQRIINFKLPVPDSEQNPKQPHQKETNIEPIKENEDFISLLYGQFDKDVIEKIEEMHSVVDGKYDISIQDIFAIISQNNQDKENTIQDLLLQIKDIEDQNNRLTKENIKILHIFDEELIFLQKIIRKEQLGEDGVLTKNENEKSFNSDILRHSMTIRRFIDTHMGAYNKDTINSLLKQFQVIDSNLIFEFIRSGDIPKRIEAILSTTDKSEIESQIEIIIALIIVNGYLCDTLSNSQQQTSYLSHENKNLKSQIEDVKKQKVEETQKEDHKKAKKTEEKLVLALSKFLPEGSKPNSVDSLIQITSDSYKKILSSRKSAEAELNGACEKLILATRKLAKRERQIQKLKTIISALQTENESERKSRTVEFSSLQSELNETKSQNNELNEQVSGMKETIKKKELEISFLNRRIIDSQNSLNKMNENLEEKNSASEVEIMALSARIEELQKALSEAQNNIQELEEVQRKHNNDMNEIDSEYKKRYEAILPTLALARNESTQMASERNSMIEEMRKLRQENSNLIVLRKMAEMKLSTYEERMANTIKTCELQMASKESALKNDAEKARAELESIQESEFAELYKAMSQCFNNLPEPTLENHSLILRMFAEESSKLSAKRRTIEQTAADLREAQCLLAVDPTSTISSKIKELIGELDSERLLRQRERENAETAVAELERKMSEFSSIGDIGAALLQWRQWARQVDYVISGAMHKSIPDKQLMGFIEEAVATNKKWRKVTRKLNLLRTEKKALLSLPMRSIRISKKQGLVSVILVVMSLNRIRKQTDDFPEINV